MRQDRDSADAEPGVEPGAQRCGVRESYESIEHPAKPTAAGGTGRVGRARLLDDLVGSDEDGLRDRQPESLGGLEVDDQFELDWLLDREIYGLGAL